MSENKKKRSYYKSKRKTFFFDKENKIWYFTIVCDPLQKKYCYVGYSYAVSDFKPGIIGGLTTYRLCAPGACIIEYEEYIQLNLLIQNSTQIKSSINKLLSEHNKGLKSFEIEFGKKHAEQINQYNNVITKLVSDRQIFGF